MKAMECRTMYWTTVILMAVISQYLFSGVLVSASSSNGLDLSKTVHYVRSLERRVDFPVSASFAYYYLYSMNALGEDVPQDKMVRLIVFLLKAQNRDGGFSDGTPYSKTSSPLHSYFALSALRLANGLDKIRKDRAVNYLLSLEGKDGGFSFVKGGETSLSATFYCIMSLSRLGALERLDKKKIRDYVMSFQSEDGGFAFLRGKPGNVTATYWAGMILMEIDYMDSVTKDKVAAFISATRYSGKVGKKFYGLPKVDAASKVYELASRLGKLDAVDLKKAKAFIQGLYIPQNGGFGPLPGYGTTPPSTFHALRALKALGFLGEPSRGL